MEAFTSEMSISSSTLSIESPLLSVMQQHDDSSDHHPLLADPDSYDEDFVEKGGISFPSQRRFILSRLYRFIRYRVFSTYRVLFCIVFIANLYVARHFYIKEISQPVWFAAPSILDISNAVAVNILGSILLRQDYIINIFFAICWWIPFRTPLRIRRVFAGVYCYGGLHSAAGICATLWFTVLTWILLREFRNYRMRDPHIKQATYAIVILLWAMCLTAYPRIRSIWHNLFEHMHRWAGWACIIIFWIELHVLTNHIMHQSGADSYGAHLTRRPDFWMHVVSTFHIFLPWLRLRRLPIVAEPLSSHVIRLHIKEKVANCRVYRIACSPLGEWHSFACIPSATPGSGGSLIVSDAGDWTRRTIDSPRKHYWTRGIPTVGVLCMTQLFRRVVIVTTGSGIGPTLGTASRLRRSVTSCHILWSASGPRQTFGETIVKEVLEVDAKAVIIDTKVFGRPDLVQLAYELYVKSNAEAIFVVSNKATTQRCVFELGSRGVPAYGPIWDS
ncbi:MAG: hypothetical protein MMC33_007865 [Icmadophila ericetorum]|nr:hypothetical protein [Icmadophila ericetorum]